MNNKWAPFNSIMDGKIIINQIIKENNKISKPVLSDDQLNTLNNNIIESYNNKSLININYYSNGNIFNIKGIINFIDINNKYLIIKTKKIYFSQIINTEIINF